MGWLARLIQTRTSAPRIAWQGAMVVAVIGMATGVGLSSLALQQPARPGTSSP